MSDLLILMLVATLVTLLVLGAGVWAATRAVDASARLARRTRQRVADTLPSSAVGRQLWYLATRLDRVIDYADWSRRVAARSGFADEVAEMSADLDHGCAVVRAQLRGCSSLRGAERHRQVAVVEEQIVQLEDGARALVELVMQIERSAGGPDAMPGADVARRAALYRQALDELHDIDNLQRRFEAAQDDVTPEALESPAASTQWVPPRPAAVDDADEQRRPRQRRKRPQAGS
jgi:hypothetical protein